MLRRNSTKSTLPDELKAFITHLSLSFETGPHGNQKEEGRRVGMELAEVWDQLCSVLGYFIGGFCTSSLSSCLVPSAPVRPFAMTS